MLPRDQALLACPETRAPVEPLSLSEAEGSEMLEPVARTGSSASSVGRTPTVLRRQDGRAAYPILDGMPVMLVPEMLVPNHAHAAIDLNDRKYAEAYDERDYYEQVAEADAEGIRDSDLFREISVLGSESVQAHRFPEPRRNWVDAPYEPTAQWAALQHIAPLEGNTLLQLGGNGAAAVKLLFGGLREAWLVTPMVGEAKYARALARACGVEERLKCVIGVAEELPFQDETFDLAYTVGCMHHMVTELAVPEISRVLRPGGRFAAVEPWRAPLHVLGTRLLGKREPVHCRPLTTARVRPTSAAFGWSRVSHHGALTRYPLLVLDKLGIWVGMRATWRISVIDDAIASLAPPVRRWGSAVAVLAVKAEANGAAGSPPPAA